MDTASHDDHGHGPPGADASAVRQGHENDTFGVRAILFVPMLVVIALIFCYVLVTTLIGFAYDPERMTPADNVPLANRNREAINQRFSQISSTDIDARVKQPRLEYLKVTKKDSENELTEPPYVRSKIPTTLGNSPEYRPESLLPDNFIDPMTGRKILVEYRPIGGPGDQRAQIPIAVAMNLVVEKSLLPTSPNPVAVSTNSAERPKLSNAGRGGVATPPSALGKVNPTPVSANPEPTPKTTPKNDSGTNVKPTAPQPVPTPKLPQEKGNLPSPPPTKKN